MLSHDRQERLNSIVRRAQTIANEDVCKYANPEGIERLKSFVATAKETIEPTISQLANYLQSNGYPLAFSTARESFKGHKRLSVFLALNEELLAISQVFAQPNLSFLSGMDAADIVVETTDGKERRLTLTLPLTKLSVERIQDLLIDCIDQIRPA